MKKITLLLLLYLISNSAFSQETGCFDGNCINGQGTYTWADGSTYVGEWKDDKQHGQGTYTSVDGKIKKGYWIGEDFFGSSKTEFIENVISNLIIEFLSLVKEKAIFTIKVIFDLTILTIKVIFDFLSYLLMERTLVSFLLIFFGVCLYQFFGINIPSIALLIILYPFKQLALLIIYFFSLTLVKIFLKTLLIFTTLFLIYLVIGNIGDILLFLLIISPILLLIWLSIGNETNSTNDTSLFKGITALGLYNNAKENRKRRERNRNRDF